MKKQYLSIYKDGKIFLMTNRFQRLKLSVGLFVGKLILNIDPENINSLCNQGFFLLGLGRTEQAIKAFEKTIVVAQRNNSTTCVDDARYVLEKIKPNLQQN